MSTTFPGLVHDAEIRHDGSNSYRLMQLGCLESVANSTVAYSSSSPLTYPAAGTEFASPYFSTNHQYTPLHHQSFHYEFQHSHPTVTPDAYSLNSLHHSQQYYQQLHHGEPADFINLHNARALKSSCLDEQRRELGCLDAYRRHDLSLMSHGSQYGMHPDQRLLPGPSLGLAGSGADELQVKTAPPRRRAQAVLCPRLPRRAFPPAPAHGTESLAPTPWTQPGLRLF
uniref:Transcription factor AP-2-delta n=1 Tax=Sphaerodactylus townsendi TaxID=933632 RepID=A0ACB8GF42_9SAUR